ncbi:MAG: hypothetical protein PHT78_12390 [Desulfitobacteriaceae bacterium]|nr:hypothetical protein [Desulfitobacteriaceae bacterium]
MQYTTSLLIPDQELTEALALGYRECFELAEYFDVTGEFIQYKLSILKT